MAWVTRLRSQLLDSTGAVRECGVQTETGVSVRCRPIRDFIRPRPLRTAFGAVDIRVRTGRRGLAVDGPIGVCCALSPARAVCLLGVGGCPRVGYEQTRPGKRDPATATRQRRPGNGDPATATRQRRPGNRDPATATRQRRPGNRDPATATRQPRPGKRDPATEQALAELHLGGKLGGLRARMVAVGVRP